MLNIFILFTSKLRIVIRFHMTDLVPKKGIIVSPGFALCFTFCIIMMTTPTKKQLLVIGSDMIYRLVIGSRLIVPGSGLVRNSLFYPLRLSLLSFLLVLLVLLSFVLSFLFPCCHDWVFQYIKYMP